MTTPELSVKVVFNGEMRRFPFSGTSFQTLRERIADLLGLGATPIVVKYTDEDGDLITVSSDLELKAAITPGKMLRLEVSIKQQQPQQSPNSPILLQPAHPIPSAPPTEAFNPFKAFGQGCAPSPSQRPQQEQQQQQPHSPYVPPHHRSPYGHPFGPWDKEAWQAMKIQHKAMKEHVKGVHKAMKQGKYPPRGPPGYPGPHPPSPGFAPHHPPPPGFGPPGAHGYGVHPFLSSHEKLVARHVKDVTIEDGSRIPAGTSFVKTWRVRNEGAPWPAGCQLSYNSVECDNMNGPEHVTVEGVVSSNAEIDISVPLVAPSKTGRYTGYWKMRTPDGKKFGQRLWVTIVVPSATKPGSSSASDEETADKYEALVDSILAMGFDAKRHRVLRLLQKYNGDIEQVTTALAEKQKKAELKAAKRTERLQQQVPPQFQQQQKLQQIQQQQLQQLQHFQKIQQQQQQQQTQQHNSTPKQTSNISMID